MIQIPKGFQGVSFDQMLKRLESTMPTLEVLLTDYFCSTAEAVRANVFAMEQRGLVQLALSPDMQPSVWTAPFDPSMSVEDQVFLDQLASFWDVSGHFNARTGAVESQEKADALARTLLRVQTPEGEVAVAASVLVKLHQLKLITRDDKGFFHGPSQREVLAWIREHGICDFCSDPTPTHVVMVPEFNWGPDMPTSDGEWAACEACYTIIQGNRRSDLLQRAVVASKGGRMTAAALKGLHRRFWEAYDSRVDAAGVGAALIDFIEDRISPDEGVQINPKLQQKAARMEAIRRLTGLTQDEMDALNKGDVLYKGVAQKLATWRKKFGADGYAGSRKIAEMLNASEEHKFPPGYEPHWQIALNQQGAAIQNLKKMEAAVLSPAMQQELAWMEIPEDLQALRIAEAYSFNEETMQAIREGAKSIPHESPLSSVELPNFRAGWYWFSEPFPVASSLVSAETTAALLWAWDTSEPTPTLRFSAYVVDQGKLLPSTKWHWPLTMSFHDMIALSMHWYTEAYGPGGIYEKRNLVGREMTLTAIAELSLFFLMTCTWFKQKILVQTPGHIERHARKRMQKERKLTEAPTVRVIALRKSIRDSSAVSGPRAEGEPSHLKVRFVVSGHARLQPCGPGRKDRKLIWIDPFTKGPDDAPFKPSATKVYAVVR